ncbi:MAG: HNH endonuclease signature motif containing protein [Bryobacteraceae bacterium]|jgi:hypothetical protein
MPFNRLIQKKIVCDRDGKYLPCVMCGARYPLPDAAHIIDKKEWKGRRGCDSQSNGMPLCPNCHRVLDDIPRPYPYRSLRAFGVTQLPQTWKLNNKHRVIDQDLGFADKDAIPAASSASTHPKATKAVGEPKKRST